jgi:hypothetical protein
LHRGHSLLRQSLKLHDLTSFGVQLTRTARVSGFIKLSADTVWKELGLTLALVVPNCDPVALD